jgi:hypothetical protein
MTWLLDRRSSTRDSTDGEKQDLLGNKIGHQEVISQEKSDHFKFTVNACKYSKDEKGRKIVIWV